MTTFSAGCDGQVRMWNPSQGTNSVQVIGKHDQPVRLVFIHLKYIIVILHFIIIYFKTFELFFVF